jgi:uncharacterized iron-regulated membrane protein
MPARKPGNSQGGTPFHAVPATQPKIESTPQQTLDQLAAIAKQEIPGWKSVSIQVPSSQARTVSFSIDKSNGGEPEQVTQLALNRESGHVDSVRRFSDNNLGNKLRSWSRALHTGEEFGIVGETIGSLACIGACFLVWTGLALTIRRAIAAWRRSLLPVCSPGDAGEGVKKFAEELD